MRNEPIPTYAQEAINWASTTKPEDLRLATLPEEALNAMAFHDGATEEEIRRTYDVLLCIMGVYARQVGLYPPVIIEAEVDLVWMAMAREHSDPETLRLGAALYLWTCGQAQRKMQADLLSPASRLYVPNGNRQQRRDLGRA